MTGKEDAPPSGWIPRVGWLVAAVGLPSAIGATWRHLWALHPTIGALLLLAYWMVLAVARFAGSVARGLTDRWRDRLVERIDHISARWFSGFGKRYIEYVLNSVRYVEQKGLPTIGFYQPELDEVFVDVSLARGPPHHAPIDPLADLPAYVTERLSIGDFLDRQKPVVLAVIGPAGSGKTTLLRHTARRICQPDHERRRHIPVLLYLRDHSSEIVDGRADGLPGLFRSALGRYGSRYGPEPAGWFDERLRDGDCVVLLDGLDEVAGDTDRRTVSAWVEAQISQYPKNDYVITSRPHGYRAAPIEGATIVLTRSFTEQQVTRFVRGWYLAVERRSTGANGEGVRVLADSGAEDLLERLRSAPALHDLTVNPLLLMMIVNVHRFRGTLPGSRADLYRDICEAMLWRRQDAKRLTAELVGEHKEVVLRRLAFTMMQNKVSDLTRAKILAAIKPGLSRVSRALSPRQFLEDIGSSGLLVERENGIYSFTHHTFQEYLAAAHIRERGELSTLTRNVEDPWWRETILLYAARADAGPIIEACLTSGQIPALALAFDCAEAASELDPKLWDQLDALLSDAANPSATPERRTLAAAVIASRQLSQTVRLGDGTQICAAPVTWQLYRLFIEQVRARGEDHAPTGAAKDASAPHGGAVVGVRAADAVKFIKWINLLLEGDIVLQAAEPR